MWQKPACNATYNSLNQFINREKQGTKEGESEWTEEERIEESMFPLVLSPHVSDSPMDDLWWALSSSVIGRHVGSKCGNECTREAEISQDLCGQCLNSSNLQKGASRLPGERGRPGERWRAYLHTPSMAEKSFLHSSLRTKLGESNECNHTQKVLL